MVRTAGREGREERKEREASTHWGTGGGGAAGGEEGELCLVGSEEVDVGEKGGREGGERDGGSGVENGEATRLLRGPHSLDRDRRGHLQLEQRVRNSLEELRLSGVLRSEPPIRSGYDDDGV